MLSSSAASIASQMGVRGPLSRKLLKVHVHFKGRGRGRGRRDGGGSGGCPPPAPSSTSRHVGLGGRAPLRPRRRGRMRRRWRRRWRSGTASAAGSGTCSLPSTWGRLLRLRWTPSPVHFVCSKPFLVEQLQFTMCTKTIRNGQTL
jgi:hypothetical protein